MKIDKETLLSVLKKVKEGIAEKQMIDQSDHFIFDKNRIWAFDNHIYVSAPFKSEINGAVKSKEFTALISKMPKDDDISIVQKDNVLILKCKNVEAEFIIDTEIRIKGVNIPAISNKAWKALPVGFADIAKACATVASKNENSPEFTCIYADKKYILSCDGFRGIKHSLPTAMKEPVMIPASAATKLPQYTPTKYMIDPKIEWVHFINKDKLVFSANTIAQEYPHEKLIALFSIHKPHQIKLPDEMKKAIERAQILVNEDFDQDRIITIEVKDKQIICTGRGPLGKILVKITTKIKNKNISINVHPDLISEALGYALEAEIDDEKTRLKLTTDKFEYFTALSNKE